MEHLKDTFKHKGRRRQLIEELATMGIHDTKILDASMLFRGIFS